MQMRAVASTSAPMLCPGAGLVKMACYHRLHNIGRCATQLTHDRADDETMTLPEAWAHNRSPEELASRLRAIGQRATPQRLLILGAFAKPGEHLTAEEVYDRVGPLSPAVNRSTVYRTLELFRDLGLI